MRFKKPLIMWNASEVWFPAAKAAYLAGSSGTAEAVPFPNALFPSEP
jgi:hypothetical protein